MRGIATLARIWILPPRAVLGTPLLTAARVVPIAHFLTGFTSSKLMTY